MKSIASIVLIVACSVSALGVCPPTATTTCNETAWPTLPAAGGKFTDPDFGTEIMRVTDASTASGDSLSTVYSYYPTFNCAFNAKPCAGTPRVMVFDLANSHALFYTFDKSAFTIANKTDVSDLTMYWNGGEYWSRTDPDTIYVVATNTNPIIYSYNVATGTKAVYKDLTSLVGSTHYLQQIFMTRDLSRVTGLVKNKSDDTYYGAFAYDLAKGAPVLFAANYTDNEIHISTGGRFLIVNNDQPSQRIVVYDTEGWTSTETLIYVTDDGFSHEDESGVFLVGRDANNDIVRRTLGAMASSKVVLQTYGSDYTQSDHVSMLADSEQYALYSVFEASPGPTFPHTNGKFHNEILFVSLSGDQSVYRVCHHHSVFVSYWESPRAVVSGDGKWIAFTSNNDNAAGRLDVFIARATDSPVGGNRLAGNMNAH